MEEFFKAKAKERMLSGKPVPISEQGRTIKKISDVANVGKDTIAKVKAIQEKAPDPDSTQKGKFLQSFEC
jgi:hypothetical protein